MPHAPFVSILQREQRRLNLQDAPFARYLDVSPSLWCLVQRGERGVGTKLILRAFATFPHRHDDPRPAPACTACDLASALTQPAPAPRRRTPTPGVDLRRIRPAGPPPAGLPLAPPTPLRSPVTANDAVAAG